MEQLIKTVVKKSKNSSCKSKVVAIGFDKKNNILGVVTNTPRFDRFGGSIHAEMRLIRRYKRNLNKIYIFRINNTGGFLPIHPCPVCQKMPINLALKL